MEATKVPEDASQRNRLGSPATTSRLGFCPCHLAGNTIIQFFADGFEVGRVVDITLLMNPLVHMIALRFLVQLG